MAEQSPLPPLGVGLVFVPGLESLLKPGESLVDVIEIEPQTLWNGSRSGIPPGVVDWLRSFSLPIIAHGVGAPVAGTVAAPPGFLDGFAGAVRALGAIWASEHLNFNRVRGEAGSFDTGLFLPPLQTDAGVSVAAVNIRRMKQLLGLPFAVETPVSYLRPRRGELSDGEFLARVVEAADCGILLDLHNVWTNERNGRQSVAEFLQSIPLERVWEVHFAGGFEHKGFWLDAHSGKVPEDVFEIAADLVPRLPNLRALIFEILSSHVPRVGVAAIEMELRRLRDLWAKRMPSALEFESAAIADQEASSTDLESVHAWECALGQLVTWRAPNVELDGLAHDPGIEVMQDLVWQFRAGAIVDLLPKSSRFLLQARGEPALRTLLNQYFADYPPRIFSADEALCFADFLQPRLERDPELSMLLNQDADDIRSLSAAAS
jgi:uncharacterized protein